jgi:hypothetical protein
VAGIERSNGRLDRASGGWRQAGGEQRAHAPLLDDGHKIARLDEQRSSTPSL